MKTFSLTHYAYCGMSIPMGTGDFRDMRAKAKRVADRRRSQGYPVAYLNGNKWEIQEPDGCCMVPDQCGVMAVERAA